jgi:uncharacterized protein
VIDALERLIGRDLAARLPRRPGQKEERYTHLLGDDEAQPGAPAAPEVEDAPAPSPTSPVSAPPAAAPTPDPRVARLEDEVAALRADLDALRASLDALRADLGA